MKKLFTFVLTAVLALSLTACGRPSTTTSTSSQAVTSSSESSSVQISNPFVDCKSLEDATAIAGFDIVVPDLIDGYTERIIRAVDKKMIEVIYNSGEKEIRIRKAIGAEDISGDYKEYSENTNADCGSLKISMRGADSKINVATWIDKGYTFSLSSDVAITSDTVLKLVEAVK